LLPGNIEADKPYHHAVLMPHPIISVMFFHYFTQQSIAISLSVHLSVNEHISRIAGPIFMNFFVHFPCGRGSVLLWQNGNTLYTSGFMDYVTFDHNGPYGD